MKTESEIEDRLKAWAREYGGRDWSSNGWPGRNILASLIAHGGIVPDRQWYGFIPINTPADEVEALVMQMERASYFKPGRVLRCEYFMLHSAFEVKLQNLRAIGLPMSKAGYYNYLAQAKAYVAGALERQIAAVGACA